MYLIKTPRLLQWYYPSLTWHKNGNDKVIYLTFDDGPVPDVTPFVLKTLGIYKAKATFFCIGDNIRKHPEIFAAVKAAGHSIGNHTFNHLNGWKTNDHVYLENVLRCQELTQTKLFRPPYGRIRKSQIKKIHEAMPDQDIIMWNVLSGDFDVSISGKKCYQNVSKRAAAGSIIVFHDSVKAYPRLEYALPRVLDKFAAEGYRFSAL